ncbi:MAG TPA: DUF1800 family protein, partial [Caulobacteraceae bacterium]|nr:DUF1800 family protein [Caulobacteraceae bacterium]
MALDPDLAAAIAVTRFGLGAKPGEILTARDDPRAWLQAQIRPVLGADLPSPDAPSSAQRLLEFREYQREKREAKTDAQGKSDFDPVKAAGKIIRDDAGADFLARVRLAATTDAGFRERWALFWANHFTVSATKAQVA